MINEQKRVLVELHNELAHALGEFGVLEYSEVAELRVVYRKILTRLHGHRNTPTSYEKEK